MNIISKLVFSLSVITVLISINNNAYAGDARTTAMGMTNETLWMIETDEGYIDMNPAYLSKFNQEIFYNTVKKYGGIFVIPMEQLSLYVSTGNPLPDLVADWAFPATWGVFAPAITMTQEQMNLTGSYNLGGLALGAKISYSTVHDKRYTSPTTNTEESLIISQFGAFYDIGSGMDIDGALTVNKWKLANKTTRYRANPIDYRGLVRFNMALNEVHKLHVLFDMNMLDRSSKTAAVSTKDEYMAINTGISDEISINKTSLVYVGTNFIYGTKDYKVPAGKTEKNFRSVKFSTGMETAVTDSLIVRTGFYKYWYYFESQKTPAVKGDKVTAKPTAATNFHIGMGYKLGNVDFNWELAQALIQNGPDFISGSGGAAGLVSLNFDITYHFDAVTSNKEAVTTTVPKSNKKR